MPRSAKQTSSETIPATLVIEEIDYLKQILEQSLTVYRAKMDADLEELRKAVVKCSQEGSLTARQLRDLRDMLTLCRTLRIKPEKGRRKDLKAIESLIEQLQLVTENW
ncbi:MAG TPA: hypothetical protein VIT21_06095 [Chthoniobacterales bacterium]